jgi:hypothetical protein
MSGARHGGCARLGRAYTRSKAGRMNEAMQMRKATEGKCEMQVKAYAQC